MPELVSKIRIPAGSAALIESARTITFNKDDDPEWLYFGLDDGSYLAIPISPVKVYESNDKVS